MAAIHADEVATTHTSVRGRAAVPHRHSSVPVRSPAMLASAIGLAFALVAMPAFPETAALTPVSASGERPQAVVVQPVEARQTACRDLKSRVQADGALAVRTGPSRGELFHHRVPQCDVWHRSQFVFVVAQDGWCGLGYICGAKLQP